ncbi:unnamed protein product [Linum tenue]|nr:unnamed protein product [Linum tenue]
MMAHFGLSMQFQENASSLLRV